MILKSQQNRIELVTRSGDYQDAKADVILKYSPDEARNLKSYGEFPESVKINETVTFGDEQMDDGIDFEEMTSRYMRSHISIFFLLSCLSCRFMA